MIFISAASAENKKDSWCFNASQSAPQFQKVSTCTGGGKEHAISEKAFRSPHVHRFSVH
jgi:hypothetical protein